MNWLLQKFSIYLTLFSWLVLWEKLLLKATCESHSQTATVTTSVVLVTSSCVRVHTHLRFYAHTFPLTVTGVIWTCFFPLYRVKQECPHPNSSLCCPGFTANSAVKSFKILFKIFVFCTDCEQALNHSIRAFCWPYGTKPRRLMLCTCMGGQVQFILKGTFKIFLKKSNVNLCVALEEKSVDH